MDTSYMYIMEHSIQITSKVVIFLEYSVEIYLIWYALKNFCDNLLKAQGY